MYLIQTFLISTQQFYCISLHNQILDLPLIQMEWISNKRERYYTNSMVLGIYQVTIWCHAKITPMKQIRILFKNLTEWGGLENYKPSYIINTIT